ncbi:hypothetical protein KM043_007980 [Ampulex compressa]|nr:hypothetical protein KM043_007980 [Ampulex compressa]
MKARQSQLGGVNFSKNRSRRHTRRNFPGPDLAIWPGERKERIFFLPLGWPSATAEGAAKMQDPHEGLAGGKKKDALDLTMSNGRKEEKVSCKRRQRDDRQGEKENRRLVELHPSGITA